MAVITTTAEQQRAGRVARALGGYDNLLRAAAVWDRAGRPPLQKLTPAVIDEIVLETLARKEEVTRHLGLPIVR